MILSSDIWVSALIRRAEMGGAYATVVRKGDPRAGAVLVKVLDRGGGVARLYAEEPRLQHRMAERARRLATLIVSKAPDVNAALFVAPVRGCGAEQVAARFARLDVEVLVQLYQDQQAGRLTPAIADRIVWSRPVAA